MVTHEELEDAVKAADKQFELRRENVERHMADQDRRIDEIRKDFKDIEKRLTEEIRNTKRDLIDVFRGRND